MSQIIRIPDYHYEPEKDCFILDEPLKYFSPRYGKTISVPVGYTSDGATGAMDIISASWWVHDRMCDGSGWDDGTQPTRWEASQVLHDILKAEGYWMRAEYWRLATYWFGGKKLRAEAVAE